ncbi:GNAT family N-acetyltransferase [Halobacillus sp. Nhm2S1]|uniref:GNAT family N-acetyltransferase n=1 Tax=Halobacillus sp. Nhm2S1 TaxID=2866716 RepID=UPI001C73B1BA|nr:GNAT family N-acetyltransferase [Halobacillus sp. Nhm2S1]MBX0358391.1 GNAT family N-acetyltransferase [Halobacillus sp. Nhm2S1]
MKILNLEHLSTADKVDFFHTHWGGTKMVISSGVYECTNLDGFAALENERILGLITYIKKERECEIISLDSLAENKGIGTALIQAVEAEAKRLGCSVLRVITTNDNIRALAFYQKRGFRMTEILHDAVQRAREIKPEIPAIGNHGIPIVDELLLKKEI